MVQSPVQPEPLLEQPAVNQETSPSDGTTNRMDDGTMGVLRGNNTLQQIKRLHLRINRHLQ